METNVNSFEDGTSMFNMYDVIIFKDKYGSIDQECVNEITKSEYTFKGIVSVLWLVYTNNYLVQVMDNRIIRVAKRTDVRNTAKYYVDEVWSYNSEKNIFENVFIN